MMEADYIVAGIGRSSDDEPGVDREPDHESEAGLEEQLVRSYADFLRGSVHFLDEGQLCANLRDACSEFPGFNPEEATNERLLEAARDCYERRVALRARIKAKRWLMAARGY